MPHSCPSVAQVGGILPRLVRARYGRATVGNLRLNFHLQIFPFHPSAAEQIQNLLNARALVFFFFYFILVCHLRGWTWIYY